MYPLANALKISILKRTLFKSFSSSLPVLAAERRKSPKSEKMKLGMTVSRSITQSTLPSSSNNMLLTLVSQWQIRFGSLPSRNSLSALHISSASFSMASTMSCTSLSLPAALVATASRNCFMRNSMLWKSGIISPSCSGTSANIAWNSPNFKPAK